MSARRPDDWQHGDTPQDTWPPIISGARQTAWIRWRGVAVTVFMWALFFFILEGELEFGWRAVRQLTGLAAGPIDLELEPFVAGMRPTLWLILFLVAVLGLTGLASLRRGHAGLLQHPPTPVPDRELADDLGLSEQEFNDIRRQRIVALDVDEQGRVSVRADWKSAAQPSPD